MRGGRDQRVARVFLRRAETAVAILFEVEYPVAEDAEPVQRLADLIGNSAQVFADDKEFLAYAFERQDRQQLLQRSST